MSYQTTIQRVFTLYHEARDIPGLSKPWNHRIKCERSASAALREALGEDAPRLRGWVTRPHPGETLSAYTVRAVKHVDGMCHSSFGRGLFGNVGTHYSVREAAHILSTVRRVTKG
jgi:hypothetical protein